MAPFAVYTPYTLVLSCIVFMDCVIYVIYTYRYLFPYTLYHVTYTIYHTYMYYYLYVCVCILYYVYSTISLYLPIVYASTYPLIHSPGNATISSASIPSSSAMLSIAWSLSVSGAGAGAVSRSPYAALEMKIRLTSA